MAAVFKLLLSAGGVPGGGDSGGGGVPGGVVDMASLSSAINSRYCI